MYYYTLGTTEHAKTGKGAAEDTERHRTNKRTQTDPARGHKRRRKKNKGSRAEGMITSTDHFVIIVVRIERTCQERYGTVLVRSRNKRSLLHTYVLYNYCVHRVVSRWSRHVQKSSTQTARSSRTHTLHAQTHDADARTGEWSAHCRERHG